MELLSYFHLHCLFLLFGYVFVMPVYSLYNDSALGLFWAMSIIVYLTNNNKHKGIILSAIVLFCMPQIKETGLIFAISTIFILGVDYVFFVQDRKMLDKLKRLGLLIVIVVVSKFSWDTYKIYNKINNSSFSLSLTDVDFFDLQEYQRKTVTNYTHSLAFIGNVGKSQKKLSTQKDDRFIAALGTPFYLLSISLSPLYWGIIFIAVAFLLYFFDKDFIKNQFYNRKRYLALTGSLVCVVSGYNCCYSYCICIAFQNLKQFD